MEGGRGRVVRSPGYSLRAPFAIGCEAPGLPAGRGRVFCFVTSRVRVLEIGDGEAEKAVHTFFDMTPSSIEAHPFSF